MSAGTQRHVFLLLDSRGVSHAEDADNGVPGLLCGQRRRILGRFAVMTAPMFLDTSGGRVVCPGCREQLLPECAGCNAEHGEDCAWDCLSRTVPTGRTEVLPPC